MQLRANNGDSGGARRVDCLGRSGGFWILTLWFLAGSTCPALTWRWSNPLPHGNNIVDMTWNGQTAVQVADLGQIYSGLGFYGWQPRQSGTTNTLQAVRFFGNRIVFVGANGTAGYRMMA